MIPLRKPMTARQREVLLFWAGFTVERGYPPSLREACAHFGFAARNGMSEHLQALERRGLIRVPLGKVSRGASVTPEGWAALGAPPGGRAGPRFVPVEPVRQCSRCGASTFAAHCFVCGWLAQLEKERYLAGLPVELAR